MRIIHAALVVCAVTGCGPVYNTEYLYNPPADPQSRACIAQCNTNKMLCRGNADLKAENERLRCDLQANGDYDRCLNRAVNDAARAQCVKRSCYSTAESAICEDDFRTCFQTCGGVVESRQVCSFNCP